MGSCWGKLTHRDKLVYIGPVETYAPVYLPPECDDGERTENRIGNGTGTGARLWWNSGKKTTRKDMRQRLISEGGSYNLWENNCYDHQLHGDL